MRTASSHVTTRRHHMLRLLPVLAAGVLLAMLLPAATAAGASGPSYVSLGDSYTSGPLIPHQTGVPAGCLRSTHNYPSLVAAALGAVSFSDVSCAAATTASMTAPQPVTPGVNPPQAGPAPKGLDAGCGGGPLRHPGHQAGARHSPSGGGNGIALNRTARATAARPIRSGRRGRRWWCQEVALRGRNPQQ